MWSAFAPARANDQGRHSRKLADLASSNATTLMRRLLAKIGLDNELFELGVWLLNLAF
jgi:hypothetical protein